MQSTVRRRCEPCAGYMRLLYTHSLRSGAVLPMQKLQTSERGVKRMALGIPAHLTKHSLGLGLQRGGSLSTKLFGRRLVERDRNSLSVMARAGLASSFEESGFVARDEAVRKHKTYAVSTGAVENSGVGGDLLERIEKLRQVIADYSYRYHTLDNPVVSDSAYDALVRELKELESELPAEVSKESVTSKVGAPPSLDLAKVRHAIPMLSLAAVYKEDELRAWHERLQQRLNKVSEGEQPSTGAWVVEPKVDGLALTLRYEKGRLVCAATRGDGSEGEDVTYNARNLTGIPQVLPKVHGDTNLHASVVEVRGEVYMTLLDFQELNAIKVKTGEKPFANPRNAAAGSIRILKNRDGVDRRLSFMAYAIVSAGDSVATGVETSGRLAKTQWDALNLLKNMGFSVNDDNRKFDSFEDALDYATRWRDWRASLKYESDGVIFKINDLVVQAKLGAVGSDPRWAVAWKFAATEVVTVLEGIELTIGRSGAIIPNARLKPVDLGGVTISRASLHNFGMVEKLGICEGDHVVVQRAGDVIPQVVQVLKDLRPDHVELWVPPARCPSCDGELTVSKDKTMTSCCNSKCPGRHSRQIEHFAKTLFKGLGPAILGDLQDAGMVADPADFYALDPVALSRLEGLGKKSAAKLVKTIEESKGKSLWELITALGISTVGVSAAKLLEKWFGSMDRLLVATKEELQLVPGVGTVSAAAIQEWCTNPFNVELINGIKESGFAPTFNDPEIEKQAEISASSDSAPQKKTRAKKALSKKSEVESAPPTESSEIEATEEIAERPPLEGKNVVITGEFENYSREELEQLVISNGGQIRKSVSSKTSFIVAGQFPGPSKMAKAAQLEIPVHDLSTFQQMLDRDSTLVPDLKQAVSGWRDWRASLKYESDGVIFKINDLVVQAKLGAVGSDPRWAVAWKFAATEVVTVLEGIELTIGRSGAIIPNARLKPVDLGGVTISRASLHNFGMVEKLGICEGDHVVVQRAGDVIPQVVQVLKDLRPDHVELWVPPARCPSCDGELTVSKDKTMTSCCNSKCPGRHSRQIEHFAKTLFKGLGPAILGDLQDAGMVADPADFYALDPVALSRLEGLGKKSAAKLVKTIEESKGKSLWELITALGISTVGVSAAKLLEKWFGSMDRLLVATKEELQLVPGVGTVSAAAIQEWCTNPFNVELINGIKESGFAPTFNDPEIEKQAEISASSDSAPQKKTRAKKALSKKSEVESAPPTESSEIEATEEIAERPPLEGKNVVITGEFENYSREELEQLVISNGGQIRKSVSSKTSFIVAGQFPGPSKMAKAAQLEIPVHDLSTFQQMLDRDSTLVPDLKQAVSG